MKPYYEDGSVTIYHGDARDLLPTIADASVALVLTDPPYPHEFLPLFGDLAQQSARALVTSGSLVTLCGQHQLPDVLDLMRPHLRYWWCGGMTHDFKVKLFGKDVRSCWKPAPWFVKESRRHDADFPMDLMHPGRRDKQHHDWGQSIEWFRHWVGCLTLPGETVLDPFMGAGTTLRAAKDLGRSAIGIEVDERHCEAAAGRCAQEVFDVGQAA